MIYIIVAGVVVFTLCIITLFAYVAKKRRGVCGSWVVCEKYEEDIVFIPENASDCTFEAGYLQVHSDEQFIVKKI